MTVGCSQEFDPAALYQLAGAEREEAARHGFEIVTPADGAAYPALLLEIPDPPPVLYVWGCLEPDNEVRLALVGARRATRYGLLVAERLGGQMAEAGVAVVSGLARGIDAAAHRGALGKGGRTIAVLGSGLLDLYPAEHRELAKAISRTGAVVSEFPLRTAPLPILFPRRNRIISGLSAGVVVVEAAGRSGALGTARMALEQCREVFAVPGSVLSPASEGTNRWLADGCAHFARGIEDVLTELPAVFRTRLAFSEDEPREGSERVQGLAQSARPTHRGGSSKTTKAPMPEIHRNERAQGEPPRRTPGCDAGPPREDQGHAASLLRVPTGSIRRLFPSLAARSLFPSRSARTISGGSSPRPPTDPDAALVFSHVSLDDPIPLDDLADRCGLPAPRLFAAISMLELQGLVVRLPGNRIARDS